MIKTKMHTKINYKERKFHIKKKMNFQSKTKEKKTKLNYQRSLQKIKMI